MTSDIKSRLIKLIDQFLSGELPFEAFQDEYSRYFLEVADAVLAPPELEYYGDIHEKAEWTAPAPPKEDKAVGWRDISEFTRWLRDQRTRAPA